MDTTKKDRVTSTAIKIIQDMNDMQQFPIQKNLKYLNYLHNPNGENINKIKKYNQIIINLYKDKKKTSTRDYLKLWLALGVDKKIGIEINTKTKEFLKNKKLVKKIENSFSNIIENYKDAFQT